MDYIQNNQFADYNNAIMIVLSLKVTVKTLIMQNTFSSYLVQIYGTGRILRIAKYWTQCWESVPQFVL